MTGKSATTNCSNAPRLPAEGDYVRTYGKLLKIEDVTPKEIVLDYIFEEEEARLEGRINGKTVKVYTTFNNFYGPDTCVESAIKEAKQQEAWLGESNLEFVVVKVVRQVRKRPSLGERENFYDREFRAMETLNHGCRWDLPDEVETVVWSSKSR
jgi:hypothetical protein